MTSTQTVDATAVSRALTNATTAASHAPSTRDTRPWRWRAHGDHLDLLIDDSRTPAGTDLDRRLAILSCGAALHHALISLAADGRHTTVTCLPGQSRPGHLATVRVDGQIPVEPTAIRHLQTIALRHTDRRAVNGIAVDADTLRSIAAAAESQQTLLHLLRPRQVIDLASASPTTMPGGGFGQTGDMAIADTQDRTAVFAVLYGPGDNDLDWLRAGEALSAVWLKATESGISVLPLSPAIESAATRETVRHLLPNPGHPYLVLRFGVLDPAIGVPPVEQIAAQP